MKYFKEWLETERYVLGHINTYIFTIFITILITLSCVLVILVTNKKQKSNELSGFIVTAYCPGRCCNGKWAGMLASGNHMKKAIDVLNNITDKEITGMGIVAVDPKVISLYKRIEWNGKKYIALDVGSKIKGKHIDILLNNHKEVVKFGIKRSQIIKIY
jgi:3D (Asp-Asp-Asp) domain-containing protein